MKASWFAFCAVILSITCSHAEESKKCFSKEEAQVAGEILNLATKAAGLNVAESAIYLHRKINGMICVAEAPATAQPKSEPKRK